MFLINKKTGKTDTIKHLPTDTKNAPPTYSRDNEQQFN